MYAQKSRAVGYDEPALFPNPKVKKVWLSLKALEHMFSYSLGRQYPSFGNGRIEGKFYELEIKQVNAKYNQMLAG